MPLSVFVSSETGCAGRGGTINRVEVPWHEPEPQPWSAAWSSSPTGARWRAVHRPWPPMRDLGVLGHELLYPVVGVALAPPPADVAAPLDSAAAYLLYQQSAHRVAGDAEPEVFLALATSDTPATVNADGTVTRRLDNTLVYVLRWENVPVRSFGGPAPSRGMPIREPAPENGLIIGMLDAVTCEFLGTRVTNAPEG